MIDTVSHYDLLELLERGDTALLYKARDRRDGSLVAVELFAPDLTPEEVRQLRRESELVSTIVHPRPDTVREMGETLDGRTVNPSGLRMEDDCSSIRTAEESTRAGPCVPTEAVCSPF